MNDQEERRHFYERLNASEKSIALLNQAVATHMAECSQNNARQAKMWDEFRSDYREQNKDLNKKLEDLKTAIEGNKTKSQRMELGNEEKRITNLKWVIGVLVTLVGTLLAIILRGIYTG